MVKKEFEELITPFTEFYSITLNKVQTNWWFESFKDVSLGDFKDALDYHIKNDIYNGFPPPGKITKAIEELKEERLKKSNPMFNEL